MVGIMLCILATRVARILDTIGMDFSGSMNVPFFKASLLRKLSAVDKKQE